MLMNRTGITTTTAAVAIVTVRNFSLTFCTSSELCHHRCNQCCRCGQYRASARTDHVMGWSSCSAIGKSLSQSLGVQADNTAPVANGPSNTAHNMRSSCCSASNSNRRSSLSIFFCMILRKADHSYPPDSWLNAVEKPYLVLSLSLSSPLGVPSPRPWESPLPGLGSPLSQGWGLPSPRAWE